jgi:FlgD Ig-like domain/WD40-like Beta Propeller Repeat
MRTLVSILVSLSILLVLHSREVRAGGVGISSAAEVAGTAAPAHPETLFYYQRPGSPGVARYRDLEFQWSRRYSLAAGHQFISGDEKTTLDQLGQTLAERNSNPFGIPTPDVQLVWDYFRIVSAAPYETDLNEPGFLLGPATDNIGTVPSADRDHVDYYLFEPGQAGEGGGHNPAEFITDKEDSSSTDGACLDSSCVRHQNSIQGPGPLRGSYLDLDGTKWTRPDTSANWIFAHEFEHGFRGGALFPNAPPSQNALDELFASGAEAVAGERDETAIREVPYTASLLGWMATGSPCGEPSLTCVRSLGRNYAGWRLFTAYLAYNFRGQDTTHTLGSIDDDLLHRWASETGRSFGELSTLLQDNNCYDCGSYFGGLADDDRLAVLLHNWRVANYVNRSDLPGSEGQYGYPPYFGFSPRKDVGAWQDRDGETSDNVTSIPPEVLLGREALTRAVTLHTERSAFGTVYPMVLQPLGAEYWVLRADTSLAQSGVDLVVSVAPDSAFACEAVGNFIGPKDGRLVASVVGYLPPDSLVLTGDLSDNPAWAQSAVEPSWVDVDSLAEDLQLILEGFGATYRAAVVVISLADGPSQELGSANHTNYLEALPYRLTLSLRKSPYQTTNPLLFEDSANADVEPSWSPDGQQIAFAVSTGSTSKIHHRAVGGASDTLFIDNSASQSAPDWSPRGDHIVYTEWTSTPGLGDLYVLDLTTAQAAKLTANSGGEAEAVFRPDGQQIAYTVKLDPQNGPWQLRRIDLSGANDTFVFESDTALASPRWSADGTRIYFSKGSQLFSTTSFGGGLRVESFKRPADSFDLHPHGGPIAIEEPGAIPHGACESPANPSSEAFRRLVLFDETTQDDPTPFYRTGASFSHPRWSPEGTRIAYVSDQNGGGDRDIFVGQVSFNHPPTFTSPPRDTIFADCDTLRISLTATDPDGETVKYRGALLPANSTLDSLTGIFRWVAPPSGDNFVVLRAVDESGGVAQKVVRISVPDTVRPDSVEITGVFATSNVVQLEWTASGDDSLTGTACRYVVKRHSQAITEANWASATHVSQSKSPKPPGEYESMAVDGLSPNTDYWFAIKVRDEAGDHLSKLSNVVHVKTTNSGGGLGESAQQVGGGAAGARGVGASSLAPDRSANPNSLIGNAPPLAVEMIRDGNELTWLVYRLDESEAQSLDGAGAGVCTQQPDSQGWSTRSSYALGLTDAYVGLRPAAGSHTRTVLPGDLELALAEAGAGSGSGAAGSVRLSTAGHSRLGDFMGSLVPDSGAIDIAVGDTLTLTYEPTEETVTDAGWFLLFRNKGQGAQSTHRLPQIAPQLPQAFALAQNRPNPFASRTTIRFDLPQPAPVRLEIFDAQGRRVAQLANGWYPAGFQSVDWDRRGEDGTRMQPGVYVYRIQAGPFRDRKKLVLLP